MSLLCSVRFWADHCRVYKTFDWQLIGHTYGHVSPMKEILDNRCQRGYAFFLICNVMLSLRDTKRKVFHMYSCSSCAAALCSSPQHQCVCAASVGSLQRKPEQLAEAESNRNNKPSSSPSAEQLCESQPGVPLHPQRPPVDRPEKGAGVGPCCIIKLQQDNISVHWAPWQAEGGRSCLCAGDWQSVPGGRSAEAPGTFTRLIEDQKSSSSVLITL